MGGLGIVCVCMHNISAASAEISNNLLTLSVHETCACEKLNSIVNKIPTRHILVHHYVFEGFHSIVLYLRWNIGAVAIML